MSKLKPKSYDLFIVAHPDDETIFFAATILKRKRPTHVVLATDGNADGLGPERKLQFLKALKSLGVKSHSFIELPDQFNQRLDLNKIVLHLKGLPEPLNIFTHGPLGEYGHPHHQDVSWAVHKYFKNHKNLYSVAYNTEAELLTPVTKQLFNKKTKILSSIYFSETKRFMNMIPVMPAEGFCRIPYSEAEALYNFLALGQKLNPTRLKKLKWFLPYLDQALEWSSNRPF